MDIVIGGKVYQEEVFKRQSGGILIKYNTWVYVTQLLKWECSVFKKNYIIDENDALSEYNKIPLGHNRTNGAVYSKSTSKLRSALHFRYSKVIPR